MARILRFFAVSVLLLALVAAGLFAYFIYTPDAEAPPLAGTLANGEIESGGRTRTYTTYVPKALPKGAPLVVVMHGTDGNAAQMRMVTGYGFDRLADEHGFVVVYPNGIEGAWNACNITGDYAANKLNIDDVGFLTALVDKLAAEDGIDTSRVFATGLSRGGAMSYRLAIEAPTRFRAVAAVASGVPTDDNFKCKPTGQGTSSVMIMNGTKDPLNPFNGGDVRLYGLLSSRGTVKSSHDSAQYFADKNAIVGAPQTTASDVADGIKVERSLWKNEGPIEVELVALVGGGHVVPQAAWRYPRILGPTPKEPDGPTVIWQFFERQRAR